MTPQETVDLVVNVISNLGFPIFVAVYMLIYHTKALKELKEAIDNLTSAIDKIKEA